MARTRLPILLAAAALFTALATPSANAWLGALGKIGSAAGKGAAGAAGKGAAAGAGAVAGAEAVQGANAAGKAAKAGVAAEGAAAASADDISRASGLGKAVPDEIAAMLHTPGKTLADVPDVGARSWLGKQRAKLTANDADLMVRDYAALLEGKPAKGPPASPAPAAAGAQPQLPTRKPAAEIPWYATELLMRAAHVGHAGARSELDRLCRSPQPPAGDTCKTQRTALKP